MKIKNISALLLIGAFLLGFNAVSSQGAEPNILGNPEITIPLTYFKAYNTDFKTVDALVSGNTIDLSFLSGFMLIEDKTELDLEETNFESDNFVLTGSVRFYDREEYSATFINSTWDAGTTTNATVNDEFVISAKETSGFANATSSGSVSMVASWVSQLAYNSNDDSDYTDATDKAYLPISTNEWMYLGMKVNHLGTVNAASYGAVEVVFERTSGTDYTISIRSYQGSGDSGWVLSGTNTAVFNAYDSDNDFIGISFPIDELYTEDSAENGDLLGIDSPKISMSFGAASETIEVTSKGYVLTNSRPAFTDNVDDDEDFDWNDDTTAIPSGVHDSDSDFLFTKITEGATESYDSKIPLNRDYDGSIATLHKVKIAQFDGTAKMYPTKFSIGKSVLVSGESYYRTPYDLEWDSRDLDDIDTFSNIFSWGNMQFNYTLDDSFLPFTTDEWDKNLVKFVWDNIDKINVYKDAWTASGVGDESEVQFDLTDISTSTGEITTLDMEVYTTTSVEQAGEVLVTEGEVVITGEPADNTLLILGAVVVLGAVSVWYFVIREKK